MKIYLSRSSLFVKIVTIGTLILLTLITFTLMTSAKSYGIIGGTILCVLIIGTVIYFYANSLDEIILDKDTLTLKKKHGQIIIPISDIIKVQKLEYSNLTMTYGSKGVFGFIGNTMDNSVSFVKDRKNVMKITSKDKKYIFSVENLDELLIDIKTLCNLT